MSVLKFSKYCSASTILQLLSHMSLNLSLRLRQVSSDSVHTDRACLSLSNPEPDLVSLSEPFQAVLPVSPDSRSVPCYPFCSLIANYLSADFWICLLGLLACTLPTVCLFIWLLKPSFTLPRVCIRFLIPVVNNLNSDIHKFKILTLWASNSAVSGKHYAH